MARQTYTLRSKVWKYPGMAAWRFITVPVATGKRIKKSQEGRPRIGFGSIRVVATVGKSVWRTSIFPDKKSGTYLLLLKAQIRKREGVTDDATVRFTIEILG